MKFKDLRSSATWGKAVITSCALLLSATTAVGQHKLSKDLEAKQSNEPVDIIVQFKDNPTAELHRRVLHHGGQMRRELKALHGGSYHVPASVLAELANDPDVAYVSPNRPLFTSSAPNAGKAIGLDHHLESLDLPGLLALLGGGTATTTGTPTTTTTPAAATAAANGTGIGVAIIDSGLAPVADLSSNRVVYSQDFTGSGSTVDTYGHGTHVAGIIAGNGASSTGSQYSYTFKGLASNVNLINLRVLDQTGAGTDAEVIAAIDQAIALKSKYNIRVINLSLGRGAYESYQLDPLCQAVEQAWKAGIVVVAAAGNYGRDNALGTYGYLTTTAPGNDPYVITVGAMNTQGNTAAGSVIPASYSSKGPSIGDWVAKPDLVAPGNMIVSLYAPGQTLAQNEAENIVPTSAYQVNGSTTASPNYIALSGTSAAAPMVTGTVALMLQQNPNLTPDQVKLRLMSSANKQLTRYTSSTDATTGQVFYAQSDLFTVGAGYLDVNAALNSTVMAPATVGSAASPNVGVDNSGYVVMVNGNPSVYGSTVLSGKDASGLPIVWGINPQQVANILPSIGFPSPSVTVQGNTVIWGSTVVWGSNGTVADSWH